MISIGMVFRGPELSGSQIDRDLTAASNAVSGLRETYADGKTPWVNAVFVVEGSLGGPGARHLEYGKYSKEKKGIVVQIPVSKDVVERDEHIKFIIDSLHGANAMAFAFFDEKGEKFPLRDAETLVSRVQQRLWKPVVLK